MLLMQAGKILRTFRCLNTLSCLFDRKYNLCLRLVSFFDAKVKRYKTHSRANVLPQKVTLS